MTSPTERFSTRVENYVKYRPRYPQAVLQALREACGLTPAWRVADIGSGTGFLTELFLQHGNPTCGVEPNAPMRAAAEALLSAYPHFTSVDGTAEETTLPAGCVELVTVGQALHWFDRARAKAEFARILAPGGWVALVWNERRAGGSPFLDAYESLLYAYVTEYIQVSHRNVDDMAQADFFAPAHYQLFTCLNEQTFDFAGLRGRLLSSSYTPELGHPNHAPMMAELARLFAEHQRDGQVLFEYETQLYYGQFAEN